ncbi:pentapeptide repeat-containing protein [Eubacterium sp. 1001713B170207_170306_E7]|uniref:pentapeptide repeat-containing protein n=1 Tax=Eubacterium sp. 1001713B170207_170306_E7 TaxID=2787097 RepID=UPI001897F04B|nr:pentapeptide repeat-containing protein [Eubacterium sp. 1001713B170207_170306_E7]
MAYDCVGAGQKVTQTIYQGKTWQDKGTRANEVYLVFLAVYRLHQMLWYLTEAATLIPAADIRRAVETVIQDLDRLTRQTPEMLLKVNLDECRDRTNQLLKEAWHSVQKTQKVPARDKKSPDFIGRNFKRASLDGQDFSQSLLIAANLEGCSLKGANLLGADLRDTNLKDADLRDSIFLTQAQINSAKGNERTRLLEFIVRPEQWKN